MQLNKWANRFNKYMSLCRDSIVGWCLIFLGCVFLYSYNPQKIGYILIGLGLFSILRKVITTIEIFGVKVVLERIKHEGDKSILKILITSIALDTSDPKETYAFFLSDQIGQIKEISQSADFSLAELEKKELIKYSQIDGQKNNTINNNKYPYKVTLINQIRID